MSHIFTILIDSLSQTCDLFEFRLFIMDRISSSLIFNDESRISVLMIRRGKAVVFDNGVHCDAKNLFKISAFLSAFNSLIYFSLAAKIILVHSFDLVSAFSKSVFFYHSYNIVLLNWSVLLIYSLQFLSSKVGPYN